MRKQKRQSGQRGPRVGEAEVEEELGRKVKIHIIVYRLPTQDEVDLHKGVHVLANHGVSIV